MRRMLLAFLLLALVAAPAAGAWSWPVGGAVLRPFVLGDDPYAGGQHRGLDVAAAPGESVLAPAARNGLIRGHGADGRPHRHDQNGRRLCGDAAPPRLDRGGRGQCGGRGRARRRGRHERRARVSTRRTSTSACARRPTRTATSTRCSSCRRATPGGDSGAPVPGTRLPRLRSRPIRPLPTERPRRLRPADPPAGRRPVGRRRACPHAAARRTRRGRAAARRLRRGRHASRRRAAGRRPISRCARGRWSCDQPARSLRRLPRRLRRRFGPSPDTRSTWWSSRPPPLAPRPCRHGWRKPHGSLRPRPRPSPRAPRRPGLRSRLRLPSPGPRAMESLSGRVAPAAAGRVTSRFPERPDARGSAPVNPAPRARGTRRRIPLVLLAFAALAILALGRGAAGLAAARRQQAAPYHCPRCAST